ncbi:hypothetical protein QJQ45_019496 [Haematococcus lacustris]|nr:hypothetical protein QJQ45_019496 [Haematococcus lacustris]
MDSELNDAWAVKRGRALLASPRVGGVGVGIFLILFFMCALAVVMGLGVVGSGAGLLIFQAAAQVYARPLPPHSAQLGCTKKKEEEEEKKKKKTLAEPKMRKRDKATPSLPAVGRCLKDLDRSKPTRLEGWKPQPGQVQNRLLRSAWSKRFEAPVRGLMWCPQLHQNTPGDLGKWVDRDCNATLNLQRAGESKWRPLELCRWPHRGAAPAKGKEYPALGFKKLRTVAYPAARCRQCLTRYHWIILPILLVARDCPARAVLPPAGQRDEEEQK